MGKKIVFLLLLLISIVAVLYKLLWPVLAIYDVWEYVCYPIYEVSTSASGYYEGYPNYPSYQPESSYTAYDCGWVEYLIIYDVASGGETVWPPEDPDQVTSGGGHVQNAYDTNNDGFIDCWRHVLIKMDNMSVTTYFSETHKAIDVAGNGWDITGQSVYSATNGTVDSMAPNSTSDPNGGGWWVKIKADDGSIWTYCHLKDNPNLSVTRGQRVTAGMTVIGIADHTGDCYSLYGGNGAHLHIQCEVNGVFIDPFDRIGDC